MAKKKHEEPAPHILAVRMVFPLLKGKAWSMAGPFWFCCFRCSKNFLWKFNESEVMKKDAEMAKAPLPTEKVARCRECGEPITGRTVDEGA